MSKNDSIINRQKICWNTSKVLKPSVNEISWQLTKWPLTKWMLTIHEAWTSPDTTTRHFSTCYLHLNDHPSNCQIIASFQMKSSYILTQKSSKDLILYGYLTFKCNLHRFWAKAEIITLDALTNVVMSHNFEISLQSIWTCLVGSLKRLFNKLLSSTLERSQANTNYDCDRNSPSWT